MSKCMKVCGPKCEECGEPATHNFQKVWIEYKVLPGWRYSRKPRIRGMDIEEPTGSDNRHFCGKHAIAFENGETTI